MPCTFVSVIFKNFQRQEYEIQTLHIQFRVIMEYLIRLKDNFLIISDLLKDSCGYRTWNWDFSAELKSQKPMISTLALLDILL